MCYFINQFVALERMNSNILHDATSSYSNELPKNWCVITTKLLYHSCMYILSVRRYVTKTPELI